MAVKRVKRFDPLIPIYLDEMIGAIVQILKYTESLTLEQFIRQPMTCDAIQHQFEILGEASSHIPFSVRKKFPHIPFQLMYTLRNHIAHEYFDIDYEIIWHIIQLDLPANLRDLQEMRESSVVANAAGE
jgi:uncharacterized protein with HEPN domain